MCMTSKVLPLEKLAEKTGELRSAGKQIVFTNGCFDILHAGHVRYLSEARKQGDALIVGMDSDSSVRKLKGESRPIVAQEQRAEVLSGLWCVDFVTFFDEGDPFSLIQTLKPDVLVKGADWPEDKIIGADFVKKHGGKVARITLVPDISTSEIIRRILNGYSNH